MTQDERPTCVRYLVVGAAALMSVLLYLDRFCISFAEIYIQEDLALTNTQVGWMLSAFFWTYALGQVPAGWLTDRFGSRIMLTTYVLAWSLFTGLTGAASVFAALLLLRLGFGFAQSGAYPTGSSIVSKWVPFHRRGTASGIISLGGRVGGFLALFASGYLIVWLTPSTTPSVLQPSDILNPTSLCIALGESTATETPIGRLRARCFEELSPASREIVEQVIAQRDSRSEEQSEKAVPT
ncbi:MAG: MFS transporter, partial [Planctomycetaceae bacterium]|nr:MFS transporter [Planctomycetaceae bacterium]